MSGVETLFQSGSALSSLCLAPEEDALHIVSSNGDIFFVDVKAEEPELQIMANTGGMPSSVTLDSSNAVLVADIGHQSILVLGDEGQMQELVKDHEGVPFKRKDDFVQGPSAMCFDKQGALYFSDAGPMGETSIDNPQGSVFTVSAEGQILVPLVLEGLAHPWGVALSPCQNYLYVAETMKNRILRFVRWNGVFHGSVFKQFAGRVGPSSICTLPNGDLAVCHFELAVGEHISGRVLIVSEGEVTKVFETPAPELTGVCCSRDGKVLFLTEQSTNSVYKITL